MEQLKKNELQHAKEDHAEVRKFVREISLKLRRRQPQDEDTSLSLFNMITES